MATTVRCRLLTERCSDIIFYNIVLVLPALTEPTSRIPSDPITPRPTAKHEAPGKAQTSGCREGNQLSARFSEKAVLNGVQRQHDGSHMLRDLSGRL